MDVLHQRIGFYMTLGLQSSAFRRHMRYNPKYAPNVYRLIDVALISKFFDEPSSNVKYLYAGSQRENLLV